MKLQNKTKFALVIFLIVSTIDIIGVFSQHISIRNFSKPLIIPSLIVYYYFSVKKSNKIYLLGLIFSFLGDVFLLGNGELYFMLGLGAFLVAHLFYIKITTDLIHNKSLQKTVMAAVPFVIFFTILISILKEHLGKLMLPVIIYGMIISIFGMMTTLNYSSKKSKANLYLFLGAIFFIVSDSMLAFNKFYSAKEIFGILIMTTYIVAQFLICKALIKKDSDNAKSSI